jgi:hypothetical protein
LQLTDSEAETLQPNLFQSDMLLYPDVRRCMKMCQAVGAVPTKVPTVCKIVP